jgi:hypothetical protein
MFHNDAEFLQFAMHNYDNPQCTSIGEFEEDLKRFQYLKKLFTRYKENDELRENLIINHLIILFNVFGDGAVRMLFHKTEKINWSVLTTFLVYLNRMPDRIDEIVSTDIPLDETVIKRLRGI